MPYKLKNLLTRVPSDIEIAQAATPIPIDRIASEAGILPEELELYGKLDQLVVSSIISTVADRNRLTDGHASRASEVLPPEDPSQAKHGSQSTHRPRGCSCSWQTVHSS